MTTPAATLSISVSSERIGQSLRGWGIALVSLALVACQTLPQAQLDDAIAAIHEELDRLGRQGFSGQVLIAHGERPLLARALGTVDPDQPTPISMESVMPLASISKAFTASALLALAADGYLLLDDPVGAHLPGLNEDWQALRLHQLLTHTSGLPAEIFNPDWPGEPRFEPIGRDELLRRINQFRPRDPPGSVFNYSNIGYNLIAAVIEAVSGQSLEHFLHQRLLAPFRIEDIGLLLPDWTLDELVISREAETRIGHHLLQPMLEDGFGWHSRGSGDLLARPAGLLAWWQAVRSGQWLPRASLSEFLSPRVALPDGSLYGFGLEFRTGPLGQEISHTGSDLGFTASWTWFPDHELMIYVALADGRWSADDISEILARTLQPARSLIKPTK